MFVCVCVFFKLLVQVATISLILHEETEAQVGRVTCQRRHSEQ